MPIMKGKVFSERDVFVDYPFEEVMFRWDHKIEKIFIKFYNEKEKTVFIPYDNELFNEALLYGDEIPKDTYLEGKKKQ